MPSRSSCNGRAAATADAPEPATLVLRVEGPAAIEIQHLAPVILERVNRFLGWRAVGRIALRQAPLRGAAPGAARPPPDAEARGRALRRELGRYRRRRSARRARAAWAPPSSKS